MKDAQYLTLVNVSGELETPGSCSRMNWSGRHLEGWFVREYDHDGWTRGYHGDTDEDGEPCPFDSEDDALASMMN